ncbi:hypothetical protein BDA96_08G184100 [Sorghum bicolor]|uniref:Uncharacterized protein n=1 Tax=Sorghum bicolor TaxID=4558 RepID=A0A921QJ10_SORBI|nr:hypothetical protein BDA96_08G184100 [Sorghum bicolor]
MIGSTSRKVVLHDGGADDVVVVVPDGRGLGLCRRPWSFRFRWTAFGRVCSDLLSASPRALGTARGSGFSGAIVVRPCLAAGLEEDDDRIFKAEFLGLGLSSRANYLLRDATANVVH